MRPIPAPRLGDTHGLLRAINERERLRLDEFITEFSIEELFPPGLENALGRTRQFVSFARSAGLLKEDRGVVELTEVGKRYVRSGDEAAVFDVSSGQAEWLRRQLFERHMTDSIYHGAAIGLSLYASNPAEFHVSRLDFGRALAHLGRAGWDNENTLESQGERYTTFLRDLELLDEQSRLTEVGTQTKSELTLPVHMSLRDLAGQLNPGGPEAAEAEGEAEWAAAAQNVAAEEPVAEEEPAAAAVEEPAPEEVAAPPAVDTGEYEDVAGVQAGRTETTEPTGRPVVPDDIWDRAAPDEATRAYSAISPEQAAAASVTPPPAEETPAAEEPAESVPPTGVTSGDPLAGGTTSGDPLAQPAAEEPVEVGPAVEEPAAVEGPGVESAAPEVAADAPPAEEPAAAAPVPIVEVPAELAADEPVAADAGTADEAAAAALAEGVAAPPPSAAPPAADEVTAAKGMDEAVAGVPAEGTFAAGEEAPVGEAPADEAAEQEAAEQQAVAEEAAAVEAAAAEEAAVADAALAETSGEPAAAGAGVAAAAAAPAPVATSTRAPSGFIDVTALKAAAEESGLKLPDSVYVSVAAALATGKHVVLAGPAGSGKTTLALAIAKAAVQAGRSEGAAIATASPKWTAHDTVGRVGDEGFTQGHVLAAAGKKKWLVIDEIDRAKSDKAFGDLSGFLGGLPLSLPDGSREVAAPKDWRIVATRDSGRGDKPSAALVRRFAQVRLPRPDAADLDAAIDRATEADAGAAAVVKRLAADDGLGHLGAGTFLDAARFAAERNAIAPASDDELEREVRAAFVEPQRAEEDDD